MTLRACLDSRIRRWCIVLEENIPEYSKYTAFGLERITEGIPCARFPSVTRNFNSQYCVVNFTSPAQSPSAQTACLHKQLVFWEIHTIHCLPLGILTVNSEFESFDMVAHLDNQASEAAERSSFDSRRDHINVHSYERLTWF